MWGGGRSTTLEQNLKIQGSLELNRYSNYLFSFFTGILNLFIMCLFIFKCNFDVCTLVNQTKLNKYVHI